MQPKAHILQSGLLLFAITFSLALSADAQTETTLYSFAFGGNGYNPVAGLLFDSAGNLYGTASEGGSTTNCSVGCGVVFQLTPSAGSWTQSVPHAFLGGKTDGSAPFVGLVADSAGNLYGTTGDGGSTTQPGYGVIFKLSPNGTGGWTETVLHRFTGGKDGANPYGNLIFDSAGNLYGTAHGGGIATCGGGCGVAFELSPTTTGSWKETVVHEFKGGVDGEHPSAALVFDSAGNLYGTATQGGSKNSGIVFRLSLSAGVWQKTLLYAFKGSVDGAFPASALVFDSSGNVYGTTTGGGFTNGCGFAGCGVVFELSPTSTGPWKETLLYTFQQRADGAIPSGVIFDGAGNLYGTASEGGNTALCSHNGCGVAFELSPVSGKWAETVLYTFGNVTGDGIEPQAGVILDSAGNLFGTTQYGGANGLGTVFEISR